ncbi:F-box/kelch-repeat protein At3g06240-like [Bidens hawaiensis]|uniref:F-box/kelch-repeat protein At3g06240-like n=1 Tax=Bidens hawaiensis TaxID=980011 RepID=UPI0040491184
MSGYVCDDLLVQIFERLPPKSVIRFRSLSKYWHSRLLSPEFLHLHRLRCSKNPPKVIIRHIIRGEKHKYYRDIYTLHSGDKLPLDPDSGFVGVPGVEFPYYLYPLWSSVIGSCNGILCLHNNTSITLRNLLVRRKLIVPLHPPLKSSTYGSSLVLGFGFDSITDDYNIVAVANNRGAFIYSLKTDSWSVIPSPSARLSVTYNVETEVSACFFNGILHWVGEGNSTAHESWTNFILTFNLSSHVFGCIRLREYRDIEQITTINGCLAVVSPVYDHFGEESYSWIRVMKEYGNTESWSTHFKLKRVYSRVFQPIINGDILAYCNHKGSKVYNTRTRLKKCLKFGPDCIKVEMDPYVESLELVDKERATTCGKTVYSWTK